MTPFDNGVAFQEGQAEISLSTPPVLFAFMGGIADTLRLVVRPEISSFAELKGKTRAGWPIRRVNPRRCKFINSIFPMRPTKTRKRAWNVMLSKTESFQAHAKSDTDGAQMALEVRTQYGVPKRTLDEGHRYVDENYYQQAMARS